MRLIPLLFLLLLSRHAPAEPRLVIERQTPPPFGLGTGSVFEHHIDLFAAAPFHLDAAQLPPPGPVNEWLEIRSLRLETRRENQGAHYRIDIEFQIFPALKQDTTLEIPPLPLYFLSSAGDPTLRRDIPPWRFTASTLIPERASPDISRIRALWEPGPIPLSGRLKNLAFIAIALAAILIFLGWRKKWFPWQKPPFARALPAIRLAVSRRQLEPAFRSFHKALNETAGQAVFGEELPRFLQRHPQFGPLKDELKWFFEDSRRLFFAGDPHPSSLSRLERLCKDCVQKEKTCRR